MPNIHSVLVQSLPRVAGTLLIGLLGFLPMANTDAAARCAGQDLQGEFCVRNPVNTGITRISITLVCSETGATDRSSTMQVWGKCADGECKWGETRARGRWDDETSQFKRVIGRYKTGSIIRRVVVIRANSGRFRVRLRTKDRNAGGKFDKKRPDKMRRCDR